MYRLSCELLIKRSLDRVFPFFENARNLAEITPGWLKFEIASKGEIHMRPGAGIEYRIRLMGVPMRWKSVITEYQPPHCFVDEQETGPYRSWRHVHIFRAVRDGTLASDEVDYSLPFGGLGRLAHFALVRHQLLAIFRYRQAKLSRVFEGATEAVKDPVIVLKRP
ncbi:MAG: SRPBCC family protein [Acidobacteriaceae bacterium]|nr:SRPBCC family protein [Acidobacteriaceae bacterium]